MWDNTKKLSNPQYEKEIIFNSQEEIYYMQVIYRIPEKQLFKYKEKA